MAVTTIDAWRIVQFSQMIQHGLQETGGKLRPAMAGKTGLTGKGYAPADFLGESEAQERVERYGDTPNIDVPHSRRWVKPRHYHWGKLEDDIDRLLTGISAGGFYQEAGMKALRRAEDRVLLGAFWATAATGEQAEETEAWSDTGYIVDKSVGGSNTGLNHAKLRAARELFTKYNVDLDAEQLWMVITEREVTALFGETTTISIDFIEGKPVSTGRLPPLYGFNFIPFSSQTLEKIPAMKVASNTQSLPVWVKSGMYCGVWDDIAGTIFPRPDKNNIPQIYCKGSFGGTRLQLGKVLKVNVHVP
jgi:hypothetical protein